MLPGEDGAVPLCAGADPCLCLGCLTCHSSAYACVTYLAPHSYVHGEEVAVHAFTKHMLSSSSVFAQGARDPVVNICGLISHTLTVIPGWLLDCSNVCF